MKYAPIALFVYNRPDHTRRTVEALSKNINADNHILYVFSDAPKYKSDIGEVENTRDYLKNIIGFKQVIIIERVENYGLSKSIINGVTELCDKYGKVIVLEDDLETSPYFLNFMNNALNFYQDNQNVMHISGCKYPVDSFGNDDTFFLHVPLCWGWATWKRAWDNFEKNVSVMQKFDRKMIRHFNFDNSYNYWKQLESNKSGKINTWFIFWYATLFLKNGLALFPVHSLVRNSGFDNSGTHCVGTNMFDVNLSATAVHIHNIPCIESCEGYEMHKKYFMQFKVGIVKRIFRKLRRTFHV